MCPSWERITNYSRLDHWSIAQLINSWLSILQHIGPGPSSGLVSDDQRLQSSDEKSSGQTGHETHLIWIRWIIPFGALFGSWYIVRTLRTLIILNKSWTDNLPGNLPGWSHQVLNVDIQRWCDRRTWRTISPWKSPSRWSVLYSVPFWNHLVSLDLQHLETDDSTSV